MPAFQQINQPSQGGVPQFQATQPVTGGGAETAVQAASIGAGLFQQAAAFGQKKDIADANRASTTALGGFQQKLLNIRSAAATDSSINATQLSRLALTEFNVNFPELRGDAAKAFKVETGVAPAGLSAEEQAGQKRKQKSLDMGYGRVGATEEYNAGQHELRLQLEVQDATATRELKAIELSKAQGSVKKAKKKEVVMKHFQTMSKTFTEKTSNETQELVDAFKLDPNTQQASLLTLRNRKMEINRMISGLGEFATDPNIGAYVKPALDEIQLAEDILLQKIDTKAAEANKNRNIAVASAMFAADPTRAGFIAQTQMLNGLTIPVSGINNNVSKFVTGGSVAAEFARLDALGKPVKAKPNQTDLTEHTPEDKQHVKAIVTASTKEDATPEQKEQAAAALEAAIVHATRNSEDYDAGSTNYLMDLLNTKGAIEAMTPEQQQRVETLLVTHVVDVVDVAVRKNITQAEVTIPTAAFPNPMIGAAFSAEGGLSETRRVSEVADIVTEGGTVYWKPKAGFLGNRAVRKQINSLNQKIAEEITPTVSVSSKVTGTSFQEIANSLVLPGNAEVKDVPKKTSGVTTPVGTTDAGKVGGVVTPEMSAEAERVLSEDALRMFNLVASGETTIAELEATLSTSKSVLAMTPQEQERLEGVLGEVKGIVK